MYLCVFCLDRDQSDQGSAASRDWWKVILKGFRNKNKIDLLINGKLVPWHYSMVQAVRELAPNTAPDATAQRRNRGGLLPSSITVEYRKSTNRSRQVSSKSLGNPTTDSMQGKTLQLDLPHSAQVIIQLCDVAEPLRILRVLYLLSNFGYQWIGSKAKSVLMSASAFINGRLAAKIMREVGNIHALVRGSFPQWATQAMECCPLLLSYEQRLRFFRYTAFGCALGLRYLTGDAEEGDRQPLAQTKVQVPRKHLLRATAQAMHFYATHPTELSVSFIDEVGTGLGPTLEYYALTCEAFQRKNLRLWRDTSTSTDSDSKANGYVFAPQGLYPRPATTLCEKSQCLFQLLGAFVAKAIQDNRPLDLEFASPFYRWLVGTQPTFELVDVRDVDEVLWQSLSKLQLALNKKAVIEADTALDEASRQKRLSSITVDGCSVDDLCLDFTLPGYADIIIGYEGANTPVTLENLRDYIEAVVNMTMNHGVKHAIENFREGFNAVFSTDNLQLFTITEVRPFQQRL